MAAREEPTPSFYGKAFRKNFSKTRKIFAVLVYSLLFSYLLLKRYAGSI